MFCIKVDKAESFLKLPKIMFSFMTNNMKLTMESIKNKVEEFSKSHPNCRNFLQDIVRKAEEEISNEK